LLIPSQLHIALEKNNAYPLIIFHSPFLKL
jgi:hypothetical protein